MVHIDNDELRTGLRKVGQLRELAQITRFVGVRNGPAGSQGVIIEVQDNGPDSPPGHRYSITVTDHQTGRTARGNAYPTIEEAIQGVHWHDLDSPAI